MTLAEAGPVSRSIAQSLRILAVGNMYPPHHAGGYELMWQAAMAHARSEGHAVRILVSDYRDPRAGVEEEPDIYRSLGWYWDLHRYEFPHLKPYERLGLERRNARELARHIREFQPDIVSWWSMGCMSLSLIEQVRRAGVPAVFVVHDDWLVYGPDYDQWVRMWRGRRRAIAPLAERLFGVPTKVHLDRAGPFVFNSRYTLERAKETGLEPTSETVVHPGIDERFFAAEAPRPWRWRLVYVGRIDRQKGIDTALRALTHLPSVASLAIWGTGDEHYIAEMRRLAAGLGVADRVTFEGWGDGEQRLRAYADADAVVFPVRWQEPFGLVPLEAMGMGRPVVTTARGGTTEFVRDEENALVFEADDDIGLARSIQTLAEDADLRERLRRGGRETAANYTLGRFAEDTVREIVGIAEPVRTSSTMLGSPMTRDLPRG